MLKSGCVLHSPLIDTPVQILDIASLDCAFEDAQKPQCCDSSLLVTKVQRTWLERIYEFRKRRVRRQERSFTVTLSLARNWWSLVIRGVVAILLGVVTFAWPAITLGALVILFGAYSLVDGVFSLIGAVRAVRSHERWGALVLEGVAGLIAAGVTLFWPAITALALVYVIAAWALVTGAFEIAAAVRLRQHVSGELLLVLSGIASILFGVVAIIIPLAGALAVALIVGIYMLVFGTLLIALGFRLRIWTRAAHAGTEMPLPAQ